MEQQFQIHNDSLTKVVKEIFGEDIVQDVYLDQTHVKSWQSDMPETVVDEIYTYDWFGDIVIVFTNDKKIRLQGTRATIIAA